MSDKPRRWLQLHLSTCIMLMFVAGSLMWANTFSFSGHRTHEYLDDEATGQTHLEEKPIFEFGWPFIYCTNWPTFRNTDDSPVLDWHQSRLYANVLVGFAILAAAAFVCEWFSRRRESRKP